MRGRVSRKQGKIPSAYIQNLPSSEGAVGVACFSFSHPKESESGQFLNFEAGDEVLVVDRPTSGWCVGIFKSHVGLFPEGYVSFDNGPELSELGEVRR